MTTPHTVRVNTTPIPSTRGRPAGTADIGYDADGTPTFGVVRPQSAPPCWVYGSAHATVLSRMIDDPNLREQCGADVLADMAIVGLSGQRVSGDDDDALRARHYPDPRREALRDALTAAWEAGADAAADALEAPAMRERRRAEVDRLLAGVPR